MNLHEYQSKELFRNAGIPTLEGAVADSPQQARKAAKQLQGDQWAVKAQVHAGGRGKAGGVKMAKSLDDVELIASTMLGSRLITKQTDQMGLPINLVYIECGTQIIFEFYLSLVIDRTKESWTFIASSEGGVDIEMVAEKTPEKINKYTIDPAIGIDTHQLSLMAEFKPYNGYRISFEIDFDHPMIKSKLTKLSVDFSTLTFLKEISRARTFGFLKEIETLRSKNLALGGSLDNAIVFDDYRILNQDGLRYQDELVRHKILDVVGDLYLMGHILVGEFNGYKSGHELNNKLILKLYTDQTAWEEIEESEITDIPISYWTSALGRT